MNDKANKRNSDGELILSRSSYHAGPTAPVFLQKTYDMIESSPDHIACWSESGTSFIIKQPRDFAKSMLPLYFKHNNFSSFVRQLHFYGFRKHRHDEIMIGTMNDETRNWWEFFNEKFVRGKGELMVQIRRKTYTDATTSEKVEVEALKHSIECLQSQVSGFVNQLSELTSIVKNLVQEKLAYEPLPSKRVKPSMTAPFLPPLAPFPTTCLPQAAVHLADTMAINKRPSDTSLLDWYGMDYMVGECNNNRSINLFADDLLNHE